MTSAIAPVDVAALLDGVGGRAADVDRVTHDPADAVRALSRAGALTDGPLSSTAAVVRALGGRCLSTAFTAWGHRLAIDYVTADHPVADALISGAHLGGSAMAAGFKARSGLAQIPVTARRDGDGLVVDGVIAWASNLTDDALVVMPVALDGEPDQALLVPIASAGVSVTPACDLLSMQSTHSGTLRLDGVRLGADALLEGTLDELLERSRRPFLILQSAFCLGLAETAAAAARHALANDRAAAAMAADVDVADATLNEIAGRLVDLAEADTTPAPRALLSLRLDAATAAREAVHLEAALTGGRGFAAGSPTGRRLREAAFFAVQSPTETHLRWDLQRSQ